MITATKPGQAMPAVLVVVLVHVESLAVLEKPSRQDHCAAQDAQGLLAGHASPRLAGHSRFYRDRVRSRRSACQSSHAAFAISSSSAASGVRGAFGGHLWPALGRWRCAPSRRPAPCEHRRVVGVAVVVGSRRPCRSLRRGRNWSGCSNRSVEPSRCRHGPSVSGSPGAASGRPIGSRVFLGSSALTALPACRELDLIPCAPSENLPCLMNVQSRCANGQLQAETHTYETIDFIGLSFTARDAHRRVCRLARAATASL